MTSGASKREGGEVGVGCTVGRMYDAEGCRQLLHVGLFGGHGRVVLVSLTGLIGLDWKSFRRASKGTKTKYLRGHTPTIAQMLSIRIFFRG